MKLDVNTLKVELSKDQMHEIAEIAADICVNRIKGTSDDSNKFYTVKQLTEILHVNDFTIRRYIDLGLLKAIKKGKSFLISQQDLDEYTNQSKK